MTNQEWYANNPPLKAACLKAEKAFRRGFTEAAVECLGLFFSSSASLTGPNLSDLRSREFQAFHKLSDAFYERTKLHHSFCEQSQYHSGRHEGFKDASNFNYVFADPVPVLDRYTKWVAELFLWLNGDCSQCVEPPYVKWKAIADELKLTGAAS